MDFQTLVDALQQGIIEYDPDDTSEFECRNHFFCHKCPMNLAITTNGEVCAIYDQQATVNPYIPQLKKNYPEYFI